MIWQAKLQWNENRHQKKLFRIEAPQSEETDIEYNSSCSKQNRWNQLTCKWQVNKKVIYDSPGNVFGACFYVVDQDEQGGRRVILLTAKTKLLPLKAQSSPRLQCSAILLSSEQSTTVARKLSQRNLQKNHQYAWTGSPIILHWLPVVANCWSLIVDNRVAKTKKTILKHEVTWELKTTQLTFPQESWKRWNQKAVHFSGRTRNDSL